VSDFVDVFSADQDVDEAVDREAGELTDSAPIDAAASAAATEGAAPQLYYPNPIAFFARTLAPSYVRDIGSGSEFVWCPEWHKHPEALSHIEALWRAWEYLRLDGSLGISTWWINHADPHMRMLMAPYGCFKKCVYNGHAERTKPEQLSLPHIEPEMDLYPDY